MKLRLAALLALTSACAPEASREFELGLLGPVGPGVAAAARAEGMTVRDSAPKNADKHDAGVGGRMADWSRLRLCVGQAAVRGRTGVLFKLPGGAGGEASDYPEEWQALARVARETAALRPILRFGVEADLPFSVPVGVAARAWRHQGRLYVLLVNATSRPLPIPALSLAPWRALFEVRADPRELLAPCGGGLCLPADRVLWLEGRFGS